MIVFQVSRSVARVRNEEAEKLNAIKRQLAEQHVADKEQAEEERRQAVEAVKQQAQRELEEAMQEVQTESDKLVQSLDKALARSERQRNAAQEDVVRAKKYLYRLQRAGAKQRLMYMMSVSWAISRHTELTKLKQTREKEQTAFKEEIAMLQAQLGLANESGTVMDLFCTMNCGIGGSSLPCA